MIVTTREKILEVVAEVYFVTADLILSDTRKALATEARQVCMWLAYRNIMQNHSMVARMFKKLDHATSIHAIKKIDKMREDVYDFDRFMSDLERRIKL